MGAGLLAVVEQTLALDRLQHGERQGGPRAVAVAGLVHAPELGDRPGLAGEETAHLHLLAERDQVRRPGEAQLVRRPEPSGDSLPGLRLLEHEPRAGSTRERLN